METPSHLHPDTAEAFESARIATMVARSALVDGAQRQSELSAIVANLVSMTDDLYRGVTLLLSPPVEDDDTEPTAAVGAEEQ